MTFFNHNMRFKESSVFVKLPKMNMVNLLQIPLRLQITLEIFHTEMPRSSLHEYHHRVAHQNDAVINHIARNQDCGHPVYPVDFKKQNSRTRDHDHDGGQSV